MTPYLIGLGLLALLQLADVYTTNLVLAGGGHESNPFLAKVMDRLGGFWWVVKLAIAAVFIFLLWGVGSRPVSWVVLVALIGAYAWVIHHNYNTKSAARARENT